MDILDLLLDVAQLAGLAYLYRVIRRPETPIGIERVLPDASATDHDAAIRQLSKALARRVVADVRQRVSQQPPPPAQAAAAEVVHEPSSAAPLASSAALEMMSSHLAALADRRRARRRARG